MDRSSTTVGLSLFTIMVGAILKFAVTARVPSIDLSIVGVILMVVGGLGLCLGIWLYLAGSEPS
jgi:Flp pilus assembly protein protease CpaA